MEALSINKENAIKAYYAANESEKKLLENLFGKEQFVVTDICERIKGWEDILNISGVSPSKFQLRPDETDDELAYRQAKLIATVYNQGTVLDPMNPSQRKYFAWHKIDPNSGFGLSFRGCDSWNSYTVVGVRLCFAKIEHAGDAGKKFIEIYSRLKIK